MIIRRFTLKQGVLTLFHLEGGCGEKNWCASTDTKGCLTVETCKLLLFIGDNIVDAINVTGPENIW